jgi:hypothetical protein
VVPIVLVVLAAVGGSAWLLVPRGMRRLRIRRMVRTESPPGIAELERYLAQRPFIPRRLRHPRNR